MFRNRNWLNFMWGRPRNPHSLDNLKYLYVVLVRNHTVSEQNRSLLVETLRQIAEILVWGDQNDSSVFDFFLEKNMLSFFLKIMEQRNGGSSYLCVQLLQTLNILFENIRNETSLYYLLSNNHVNSIILHKFDFSDEEVMAYYISFLKTLSLKLNIHTIHFFYNEHTNDFPLYTEAIKFFNHSESMVRIAVRTLTLNVYKVEDKNMLNFIRDRTAAPYFSNIVSFIVKHILELDYCVQNYPDHNSRNRVRDLVAEHLDYLHYLNDILLLQIDDLNSVLINYLLNELLIPFYIYSLVYNDNHDKNRDITKQFSTISLSTSVPDSPKTSESFRISYTVALFLLSQVFLIISHESLIMILNYLLLKCDKSIFEHGLDDLIDKLLHCDSIRDELINDQIKNFSFTSTNDTLKANKTDEEKLVTDDMKISTEISSYRIFIEVVINSIGYVENDQVPLLALCLIYAIFNNKCVPKQLIERIFYVYKEDKSELVYNENIVDHLLNIVTNACQAKSKIRPVTLELTLKVTEQIVRKKNLLTEEHKAILYAARAQCMATLRALYNQEMFLDMFEYEYHEMSSNPILNVEYLCMDSAILLPPTGTPLTGIDFVKRLPCGEVEKSRKSIRTYFLMRKFYLELNGDIETQLPLVHLESCVKVDDILNLENKDLIACTIVYKNGQRIPRFIAFDAIQVIIVEPESSLGVGKAKLVGFLQDVEVNGDKDDYCLLHVTIHRPLTNNMMNRKPLLSAKFIFQDHIRCIAAKQHLLIGRKKARQKKLQDISQILEISSQIDCQTIHHYSPYNSTLKVSSRNFGKIFNEHLNFLTSSQQNKIAINTGIDVVKTDLVESSKHKQRSRENSLTRIRNRERSKSRSKSREGSPKTLPNSETFQMMRIASNDLSNQCAYSSTLATKNISTVSEETSFISGNSTS